MEISTINWELIGKKLTGEITEEEFREFQDWLNSSSNNQLLFQKITSIWEKSIAGNKFQSIDVEADLEKVKNELRTRQYGTYIQLENSSQRRSFLISKAFKVAASIIILLGLSIGATYYFKANEYMPYSSYVVNTPNGAKSNIILPDSTRIWLNSGSKITYEADFSKNRKVYLEGEAYFDVTKNPKNPFVVETSKLNITVLGTAFDVKAYSDENTIEATLVRGSVAISGKNYSKKAKRVLLEPNQKFTYYIDENKSLLSKEVDTQLYTAWKDNKLIFKNEEMKNLKTVLERWYGMDIEFIDPDLGNYHYTGTIENETINQVLEILKITMPIHYEITHRKVIIGLNN
ncbi:MAG: FecR family protein [Prolixibacteraceae bacterium]